MILSFLLDNAGQPERRCPPSEQRTPAQARNVLAIHEEEADFVWRTLQRMGVEASDLEDVFQEVFIVVHRRLHTLDPTATLTTWLFGICLRVAAAHRRRAYKRREVPTDDVGAGLEAEEGGAPDEALEEREARAALERALDEMDIEKRAVFVMFELDGMSSEEIAQAIGTPVGTVWSRLHAARAQFEKIAGRHRARAGRSR